jgi:hypothetical protein
MLRDLFQSARGIENFGLISLILFGVFFILVLIHTISLKKKDVEEFSRLPLDDVDNDSDKV